MERNVESYTNILKVYINKKYKNFLKCQKKICYL